MREEASASLDLTNHLHLSALYSIFILHDVCTVFYTFSALNLNCIQYYRHLYASGLSKGGRGGGRLPHDFECWKSDWKCGALAHFSFLQRWKDGTLDSFYFRTWHLSLAAQPCCSCPSHFLLFNSSRLPPDLLPSSSSEVSFP